MTDYQRFLFVMILIGVAPLREFQLTKEFGLFPPVVFVDLVGSKSDILNRISQTFNLKTAYTRHSANRNGFYLMYIRVKNDVGLY